MKRSYCGIALLLLLLLLGIAISHKMKVTHLQISTLLEQAADAAAQNDWPQAAQLALQANDQWQQHHKFTAAFADHTPMDELDGLFAELQIFLAVRESPHFEATCARISFLAQAMADSHGVQWWNIL